MQNAPVRPLRHRLLLELGRGGMGTVYLAVIDGEARRESLRVVKRLRPDLASDLEFVQMFLEEARLAALLVHPNIVQTEKVGFDGRHYFIEMEYLDGQSLFTIARRGARSGGVPLRLALWILADVLAGLGHAHDATDADGRGLQIVHRDVSPHNVLVTYAGGVKLLDFGIAKAVDSSLQTRTGVVKGKATYMAPEQAMRRAVDRRADVFAVGVMLWEAITGARLYADLEDSEIRARVGTLAIPSPRSVRPSTPEALDAVCMRALATAPADRYATAREMRDALVSTAGAPPDATELAGFVAGLFATERRQLDAEIDTLLGQPLDALGVNVDVPVRPPLESNVPTRVPVSAGWGAPAADERPAPERARWPRFALAAIVAATLAAGGVLYARAHHTPPASAPPDARSSAPAPDFPAFGSPMSTVPGAAAAYTAGMHAFRDADGTGAVRELDHATELDPNFAAAHLRRTLVLLPLDDTDRVHLREALRTRASLGAHDRALLDAVAPLVSVPEDIVEVERRLTQAVVQSPGDPDFTFQLCRVQQLDGSYEKAKETCGRAVALAPGAAAPVRTRALVLLRLEDAPGALDALDACLRASPLATSCLDVQKQLQVFEGKCDDALATIRRIISLDRGEAGDYADLASVLFAKGEPIEAVRGALEQRYAALPPAVVPAKRHGDDARLAILGGRFDAADAALRALEGGAATSHDEADHVFVAMERVQIAQETGRADEVRLLAQGYLARRAAWTATNDTDYTVFFSGALYGVGAIGRDDFIAGRTAWLASRKAQPRGGLLGSNLGLAWISAYGVPAVSAADASEALTALPEYAPLPDPLERSPDVDAAVGRIHRLAGHDSEALPFLRRAAHSCAPFTAPLEQTIASFELGAALAKLGETREACEAYAVVARRWGGAATSVTARKAKAALRELACSP